jgi:UDP-N-acetylmuramate dehydrogenase
MKLSKPSGEKVPLRPYNTFHVDAYAWAFIEFQHREELAHWYSNGGFDGKTNVYVLGEGSNVLLTQEEYWEPILRIRDKTLEVEKEGLHEVWIRVGGGWNWDQLVAFTVEQGWAGLENLSLIPGTVGAAPVQNIGAYGVEIGEFIEAVEVFRLDTGTFSLLTREECAFSYRNSIFKTELKDRVMITSTILRLKTRPILRMDYPDVKERVMQIAGGREPTLMDVRNAIIAIRKEKMPDYQTLGNAGSFFKNPIIDEAVYHAYKQKYPAMPGYPVGEKRIKVPAAWLIEQCGWKGKRVGDVGTYPKHALIIVNYGNATGKEIRDFALSLQQAVFEKFQIRLEPEVIFW